MKGPNKISLFALASAGFLFIQATPAFAAYGAIAFSKSTGANGTAWNWADADSASNTALANCGQYDCQVVAWVYNGCAALSVGYGNAYGWAWNSDFGLAQYNANLQCASRTLNCQVLAWVCSG